jgi:hypothetical protein
MKAFFDMLGATPAMRDLIVTLKATGLAHAMVETPWLWPMCETLHFIGLALLVGIIGLLDLRLLGYFRHIPVAALRRLLPWGIAGFVINLLTGVAFFVTAPDQYVGNVAWWFKLAFLGIAGVNALAFELTQGRRLFAMSADAEPPMAWKAMASISLLSWFMVLYWGRMLPFIGNAF